MLNNRAKSVMGNGTLGFLSHLSENIYLPKGGHGIIMPIDIVGTKGEEVIPPNITRSHIINALNEMDKGRIPPKRKSVKFLLIHNGRGYSPKYATSLANRFVNGTELGGFNSHEANRLLQRRGFEVKDTSVSSATSDNVKQIERQEESEIPVSADLYPRQVEERVTDLCSNFTAYLEYFEKSAKFTGPSIYFHLKTLDRLYELGSSALRAAQDERFCELLYSTLVAWGMHAMVSGAKMPDFEPFADSIASLAPEIDELSHYEITTLSSKDTSYITGKLWSLIARLRGSTTKSKLVANSKILHHLLPHLVPPIDRNNEAVFFRPQK